ncbi:MAG TPA: condensation domain-containing protein, partial [Jatrophihabitans sp.]|nr:condensation domain-containing protein [Jatrophihabitans sp.]
MSVGVYQFPTSYGQRRMWLLGQLDPDEPTYNIGWALWLDGPLELAALEQAWTAALIRHEALRTTFADAAGVPMQVIEEEPAVQSIPVSSVQQLPEDQREPAARALVRQWAATPMPLTGGSLIRVGLVRLSEQRHLLAVVVHHIVADGWSFRLLFDELSTDYEAIRRDGAPVVPEPAIQYADFALWQLEHADQGGFSQAERFWRTELAGAPSALPLPIDRPYPSRQSFAADGIDATIDEQLAGRLRQLAGEHGSTLFAVLLAAYALVLTRLTGQREVLVAVPMAARTRPETESVVGLFMNTVTVRVRVDERQRLDELVRTVHAATARALAQQELPFARVVELARPEREPTRLPLVQVMFALEQSWAVPDRGGLRWRPELIENGTAKFELELTVTDTSAGPRLRLNYNSAVFDRATGQLVADCFGQVLRLLAEQPDRRLAELQLLPPETDRQVRELWPDAGPTPDPDATMLSRLWQACAGDTVLAEGGDGALTGWQIRDRAAVLAARLRRLGVRPTDRVALLLPRGARLLPAILGVWSTGAAYLPLDPIYPEQRLRTMLADADVRAVVIDSAAPDAPVPPGTSELPVLDLATLTDPPAEPGLTVEPLPDLPPSAPAYVLFTSGSTGRPKAVSVTQGALAALLDATRPLFALGPADRMVAVATFAFDIAQLELLAPVLAGARLVVAETEHSVDAALLRRLLESTGATALQATPTGWRMLVDAGGVPAGVRLRISGGEPLARDLADELGRGEGVRLWNMYGPTETTIYSAGWLAEPS